VSRASGKLEVSLPDGPARHAIEAPSTATRVFADCLAPFDRETGAPIEDAWILLVKANGALSRHEMSAAVPLQDFVLSILAAIDSPGHRPRFFRPAEMDIEGDTPRAVALLAAGRIRLVPGDDACDEVLPIVVHASADDADPRAAEPIESIANEDDVAQWLREIVHTPLTDERRAELAGRLLANGEFMALLALDRPPHDLWSYSQFDHKVSSLPFVVEDLRLDTPMPVRVSGARGLRIETPDGDSEQMLTPALLPSRDEVLEIRIFRLPAANIIARLPEGASKGRASTSSWNDTIIADSEGRFHFDDVRPGSVLLEATWVESDGVPAHFELVLNIQEGETRDLGVLSVAGGFELGVSPRVLLDGVENPGLARRCRDDHPWTYELTVGGRSIRRAGFKGLHNFAVRGTRTGEALLTVVSRDPPASIANEFRPGWVVKEHEFELVGRKDVTIDFPFASTRPIVVRTRVPPRADGFPYELRGRLADPKAYDSLAFNFTPSCPDDASREWIASATVRAPVGRSWIVEVAAGAVLSKTMVLEPGSELPMSWYARSELLPDSPNEIGIELQPAAALAYSWVDQLDAFTQLNDVVWRNEHYSRMVLPERDIGYQTVVFGVEPGAVHQLNHVPGSVRAPAAGQVGWFP
jgi:hypothetical protein